MKANALIIIIMMDLNSIAEFGAGDDLLRHQTCLDTYAGDCSAGYPISNTLDSSEHAFLSNATFDLSNFLLLVEDANSLRDKLDTRILNNSRIHDHNGELLWSVYSDWFYFSKTGAIFNFADGTETVDFSTHQASPVPLPAAVWLFGSGLLGLLGYSKRKQTA